ncbi:hypothetical protein C481_05285 [Natrialba asiatica DSM 12278]|uniref:Uncharacterized protein n=1 Tax=Natrialba asiatica (strain ATCC 700177 / DSM 12278 / JCM 9576 / FERM P-10747 / NBRC 102637 / 172P1) TaxID=29540 RepID=M0AYH9_NATA1|nr:hypothetical protein C481_05285 [Natrialba asiatica DSM 12278]
MSAGVRDDHHDRHRNHRHHRPTRPAIATREHVPNAASELDLNSNANAGCALTVDNVMDGDSTTRRSIEPT